MLGFSTKACELFDLQIISREHAKFTFKDRDFVLDDLSSGNGTFVNEVKIQPGKCVQINNGDIIQFGKIFSNEIPYQGIIAKV